MFLHVRSEPAVCSQRDASSCPLDPETRSFMEQHLGRGLDDVRVQFGEAAAALANRLGVAAYASGRTIVFGHGYQPDTVRGRWLLAHELVHVIQQTAGRRTLSHTDASALERTADAAANIIASGGSLPANFDFGSAPYGAIQRHADDPCTGTRYDASAKGKSDGRQQRDRGGLPDWPPEELSFFRFRFRGQPAEDRSRGPARHSEQETLA